MGGQDSNTCVQWMYRTRQCYTLQCCTGHLKLCCLSHSSYHCPTHCSSHSTPSPIPPSPPTPHLRLAGKCLQFVDLDDLWSEEHHNGSAGGLRESADHAGEVGHFRPLHQTGTSSGLAGTTPRARAGPALHIVSSTVGRWCTEGTI